MALTKYVNHEHIYVRVSHSCVLPSSSSCREESLFHSSEHAFTFTFTTMRIVCIVEDVAPVARALLFNRCEIFRRFLVIQTRAAFVCATPERKKKQNGTLLTELPKHIRTHFVGISFFCTRPTPHNGTPEHSMHLCACVFLSPHPVQSKKGLREIHPLLEW